MPTVFDTFDHIEPLTRAAWREWLAANHATSRGVWVIHTRKSGGEGLLGYAEAVEEALCFGWIDSRPGKVDETRTRIVFTPRKPGSGWSAVNKERIERMQAAGLMMPAGQARIDAAIADGSWVTLDAAEALSEPADLRAALDADSAARTGFDTFPKSTRKFLLTWLGSAKRPETRAARLARIVEGGREGKAP